MKKIKYLSFILIGILIINIPKIKADDLLVMPNDTQDQITENIEEPQEIIETNIEGSIPTIKRLIINNKEIKYNEKLDVYQIRFSENQDKLKIYVEFDNKNISYKIEGNENIKDGSIVRIFAKNEKQETTEFDIMVTVKEPPSSIKVVIGGTSLIVAIGSLFMIIIIKVTEKN